MCICGILCLMGSPQVLFHCRNCTRKHFLLLMSWERNLFSWGRLEMVQKWNLLSTWSWGGNICFLLFVQKTIADWLTACHTSLQSQKKDVARDFLNYILRTKTANWEYLYQRISNHKLFILSIRVGIFLDFGRLLNAFACKPTLLPG